MNKKEEPCNLFDITLSRIVAKVDNEIRAIVIQPFINDNFNLNFENDFQFGRIDLDEK